MKIAITFVSLALSTRALSLGPSFLSPSQRAALEETAGKVATPGKGITACDEGPATIGGRFEAVGVGNDEEIRRQYRQMLFTAENCEKYLSAAILDPETLYQVNILSLRLSRVLLTMKSFLYLYFYGYSFTAHK